MRASDLERQRTIDELRRHCAAGRIDVDEYAARIEKAMSATTLEELDRLRADLPMMRIADPDVGAKGRVWARTALPAGESGTGSGREQTGGSTTRRRLTATAVALLSVVVVLGVLALSLVAEWAWAAVLIAGWLVGLLQGRLSQSARRGR